MTITGPNNVHLPNWDFVGEHGDIIGGRIHDSTPPFRDELLRVCIAVGIGEIDQLMMRGMDIWNEIRQWLLLHVLDAKRIRRFVLKIDSPPNRYNILIFCIGFWNRGFLLRHIRNARGLRCAMEEIDDVLGWYLVDRIVEMRCEIPDVFSFRMIVLAWRRVGFLRRL